MKKSGLLKIIIAVEIILALVFNIVLFVSGRDSKDNSDKQKAESMSEISNSDNDGFGAEADMNSFDSFVESGSQQTTKSETKVNLDNDGFGTDVEM